MFGAVFREFPEIALLSLYFLHQTPNYITFNDSLDPAGRARTYGDLWLPFVNGIFDVVPVTARIIDGTSSSDWPRGGTQGSLQSCLCPPMTAPEQTASRTLRASQDKRSPACQRWSRVTVKGPQDTNTPLHLKLQETVHFTSDREPANTALEGP